eukprot:10802915-Alexandrium_andersonii.AAC.1
MSGITGRGRIDPATCAPARSASRNVDVHTPRSFAMRYLPWPERVDNELLRSAAAGVADSKALGRLAA